ncbi:hypothetical protein A3207_04705 [Candidatus Methanomassiliicoccus intestinalis]|jgi:putative oxidoreductase|uniref:N-acetyltransferase domain-containing protein n=1 Tax=Candidatus Methanomassiliicoccus intestinalis TaxID=1406512 RepID=A0A8J8TD34_9ARCH|nr:MAG: hypothetical protein A3207_04705 [Candidatus Methanomassiliicoccus intestinalis]
MLKILITIWCVVSKITLEKVTADKIEELSSLAYKIWRECFPGIISNEQIEYMLEKFQSVQAITKQIQTGYEYYFITCDGKTAGYTGIVVNSDGIFLSKIYLIDTFRGNGIASEAIRIIAKTGSPITLTVNRGNLRAIRAYEKMGFVKIREQKADIGSGFIMDDYVMQLN